MTEVDVAVVGLGALGSATAWAAARRGASVVGLEQFPLGHERGASQDHSRIIRLSYHTPGYVRLARSAYAAWAELEADAGEQVVHRTGGLDLFPAGAAIDPGAYETAMAAEGVSFAVLSGAETRARWPAWSGLADDVRVLHQEATGYVAASRAVAALQRSAVASGVELRDSTPVEAVGDGFVVAGGETIRAGTVVVTADAWTNRLLVDLGHELPLTVLREQVTWFSAAAPVLATPTWIWMDDPSWYGFPTTDGATVKAAQDCGGSPVDPDTRTFDPDPDGEARLETFLRSVFGAALGPRTASKTCLYTLTPDRDFVLDRVPGTDRVLVALGAAHAFKFAAWFGVTLAALGLDGGVGDDLSPFRIDRPALTEPTGEAAWLA